MKEYTQLVNTVFDYRTPYELLVAKRYPGASIAIFDTNSFLTDIYNNPEKYLALPANVTGSYVTCDAILPRCARRRMILGWIIICGMMTCILRRRRMRRLRMSL
jgi:hypothetical protein